jgi:hypothetical protein
MEYLVNVHQEHITLILFAIIAHNKIVFGVILTVALLVTLDFIKQLETVSPVWKIVKHVLTYRAV